MNNCEKGHLFLRGFSNLPVGILLVPYERNLFVWVMSFYPSYGYQCTDDTWHRMSKTKLSLKKGHNAGT